MSLATFLRAVLRLVVAALFLAALLVTPPSHALPPAEAVSRAFGYSLTPEAFAALERRTRILDAVAVEFGIDPDRLRATCFVESGLAIRRPRASLCGCASNVVRGDRAQAECAALALVVGWKRCGTWRRSHHRYQSGRCDATTLFTRRYARAVTWALVRLRAASLLDDGAESILTTRGAQ